MVMSGGGHQKPQWLNQKLAHCKAEPGANQKDKQKTQKQTPRQRRKEQKMTAANGL